MTDEQMIEKLAVEVIGKPLGELRGVSPVADWNPLDNPADREMVEDKLAERWDCHLSHIYTVQGGYFRFKLVSLSLVNEITGKASTRGRAVAICALRSKGIEVE